MVLGRLAVRRAGARRRWFAFGVGERARHAAARREARDRGAAARARRGRRSRRRRTIRDALADALARVGRVARQPGLVAVICDFRDQNGWERPLGALRVHHSVIAIEIGDPREAEVPAVGRLALVDPETGAPRRDRHLSPQLRWRFAARERERREGVARELRRLRVDHVALCTGEDWLVALGRNVLAMSFGSPALAARAARGARGVVRPGASRGGARAATPSASRRSTRCSPPQAPPTLAPPSSRRARARGDCRARARAAQAPAHGARRALGGVDHARHRPLGLDAGRDVSPTRLRAAQQAAHSFIDALPEGVRLGVVAFAAQPDAAQPPTTNHDITTRVVDGQIANGGTATGDALSAALELLAQGHSAPRRARRSSCCPTARAPSGAIRSRSPRRPRG